jgi:hypothetical protein
MQRELSDDEWCKSFEYRAGTREYADCRQRIDRAAALNPAPALFASTPHSARSAPSRAVHGAILINSNFRRLGFLDRATHSANQLHSLRLGWTTHHGRSAARYGPEGRRTGRVISL